MAAAAIIEAFINETTQGKQKENMEKNKSNLKKHLQNTDPPTRDLPAPRENAPNTPTFGGGKQNRVWTCLQIHQRGSWIYHHQS